MSEEPKPQADPTDGFDALFRTTLGNHQIEPSGNVWKSISRKLLWTELAHFNFKNIPKTVWFGTASAVLIGLIFLFNQIPDGNTSENGYNPIIVKNGSPSTSGNSINTQSVNSKTNKAKSKSEVKVAKVDIIVHQPMISTLSPVLAYNKTNQRLSDNKVESSNPAYSESLTNSFSPNKLQSKEDRLLSQSGFNFELNFMPHLFSGFLYPRYVEDTLLRFKTLNGILNVPIKSKVEIPQFYSFNLGISPELSVYRSKEQHNETNYWLNAGVAYHLGKFSLQTGAALGYVFDHGDYRVNYKSKDSIGYFTSIISFIVKPGDLIVYSTKDIPVYDSLQHIADDRAISRYTYLRIPFILGYQVFETNRLSIGIKAGPAISFLIVSKEASPFIDYPNAKLIRVDNNSLVRVKMNWEVEAALDIEYRLAKKFSIYANPSYKHYFKPFETQESVSASVKDPYSIGIEIGARYNFKPKRNKK